MTPRPHVTVHFAQSLDGRIGLGAGAARSTWSSEEGFARAHEARAAHDAVLVGLGTVRADDPRLTVRLAPGKSPSRVVLDSSLAIDGEARALDGAGRSARVLVFGAAGRADDARAAALAARGVEVVVVAGDAEGRVSLGPALAALAERGIRSLLVEGGSAVLTSFARARAVDRVTIEIAPCFVGARGVPALGALDAAPLRLAPGFRVERAGASVVVSGEPSWSEPGP